MTVEQLLKAVGRKRLVDAGFSQQAISRAVTENIMPAAWFPVVRDICADTGVDAPEHLFRWTGMRRKSPMPPPSRRSV